MPTLLTNDYIIMVTLYNFIFTKNMLALIICCIKWSTNISKVIYSDFTIHGFLSRNLLFVKPFLRPYDNGQDMNIFQAIMSSYTSALIIMTPDTGWDSVCTWNHMIYMTYISHLYAYGLWLCHKILYNLISVYCSDC